MLYTYYSNKLQILANILNYYLKFETKKKNLIPINIIIQNNYVYNWLNYQIINKYNISCNIKFWFIKKFIDNFKDKYLNNKNYYNLINLFWKIYSILNINNKLVKKVNFYLNINIKNIFILSYKLAKIILNCINNYPNSLLKTINKNFFLKKIWNLIIKNDYNHKLNIFSKLEILKLIKNNNLKFKYNKIYLFALSNLSITNIEILKIINNYINIILFINTPCKYLWETNNINNNILINNWGITVNKIIHSFINFNNLNEEKFFITYKNKNILSYIKKDILYLKKNNNKKISKKDDSIFIIKCLNKLEEIYYLKEYIINILIKNNKININDIIIMVNNISLYKKYIENVFNYNYKNIIPINIIYYRNNSIINGLYLLLKLTKKKFNSNYIFKLLNVLNIQKKFNLNNDNISYIKYYINDIGPVYGFKDKKNKNKYIYWEDVINKLLLGYAINSNISNIYNNILPYDNINFEYIKIIGNFIKFINLLKYWKLIIKKKKIYLKNINNIFNKIINNFFLFNDVEDKKIYIYINKIIYKIINIGTINKINNKIYLKDFLNLFKKYFFNILRKKKYNFINNKLNFIELDNLSGLPYKIICLIGINNHFYKYKNLDLIKNIFLQILISAQEKVYISFIDKYEMGTPNIIQELVNYINNNFYYIKNNKISLFKIKNTKKIFNIK